jgi:23S rRNA pseudouridine1911/1915/1917 synthase
LGRHALHAAELGFEHPAGQRLPFSSPLPEDMQTALRALRG